ncbi:MAG: hypothetical protein AB7F21_07970 [Desulfuromonadales bacterium]
MADPLLQDIVALEKELEARRQEVASEVDRWLADVRQELAAAARDLEARLQEEAQQAEDRAAAESRAEAMKRREQAEGFARRLAGLEDDRLNQLLRMHLALILPGEAHDHRDVQG